MEPPLNDQQVFESSVEIYADSLYRVAFRLCGDRVEAEEIVQETFIAAWRNVGQLRDQNKIKSWLFGILRNKYRKSIEHAKRSPPLQSVGERQFPAPTAQQDQRQIQQQVQDAIAKLDDDHRFPLLLVAMEGWTTVEAAQWLGIPQGTVLSRLHRGRARLKQILLQDLEPDSKPHER